MSTFRSGAKNADEEVRELARVLRRMQAVDQHYWEESKFLLLRNEVALQTLFQGKATAQPKKEDAEDRMVEPMVVSAEERETEEEERVKEQRFHPIADVEVGHEEAAVERLSGGEQGEHHGTTPLHIQVLEDRINKARSDLSNLEQHSKHVETEMKMLQEEHVKLNDQLRRAEFQFDDLLREQQTYRTESFKLYHRELLNRESLRHDLEACSQLTAPRTHFNQCSVPTH